MKKNYIINSPQTLEDTTPLGTRPPEIMPTKNSLMSSTRALAMEACNTSSADSQETPDSEFDRAIRAKQAFRNLSFDLRTLPAPTQQHLLILSRSEKAAATEAAAQISALYQAITPHLISKPCSEHMEVIAPNVFCLPEYIALRSSYSQKDLGRLQATKDFQLVLAPLDSKNPMYGILLQYGANQYFLAGGQRLFSLSSQEQVLAALQLFSQKHGLRYVPGPSLSYSLALAGILKAHLDAKKDSPTLEVPLKLAPLEPSDWKMETTRKSISMATSKTLQRPLKDPRIEQEQAFTMSDAGKLHVALIRRNKVLQDRVAGLMEAQKRFQIPKEAWIELGTESLKAVQYMLQEIKKFYREHTDNYPKVYEKISSIADQFYELFEEVLTEKQKRRQRFSEQATDICNENNIARFVEEHLALLQTYFALSTPSKDASISPQQPSDSIPASFFSDLSREELQALEKMMQELFPADRSRRSSQTFIDKISFEGKVPPHALSIVKNSLLSFHKMIQNLLKERPQTQS